MMLLRRSMAITSLFILVSSQGCVFSPEASDPQAQQAALERWNRCLQRFGTKSDIYCDGHRRDVLNTYPAHLENQIDAMLSQRQRNERTSQLLKTGRKNTLVAGEQGTLDTLLDARDEAR